MVKTLYKKIFYIKFLSIVSKDNEIASATKGKSSLLSLYTESQWMVETDTKRR